MRRASLMSMILAMIASSSYAEPKPNVRLFEWQRGFAVQSLTDEKMSVYLWFYEWHMFDAMKRGQHTGGTYQLTRKLGKEHQRGLITSDSLQLVMTAGVDGADLKLTVTNRTDHEFPPIAAIIPCFNPGPAKSRNKEFANTKTYFLGPKGLERLVKREIHYNNAYRKMIDLQAKDGKYVWSNKWPLNEVNAVGGLLLRESTSGKWVCGIAWEDFLSAQGHNPWQCMHLSIRVGPLAPGKSKTVRGKIYLLQGNKEDLLKKYHADFSKVGSKK